MNQCRVHLSAEKGVELAKDVVEYIENKQKTDNEFCAFCGWIEAKMEDQVHEEWCFYLKSKEIVDGLEADPTEAVPDLPGVFLMLDDSNQIQTFRFPTHEEARNSFEETFAGSHQGKATLYYLENAGVPAVPVYALTDGEWSTPSDEYQVSN